MHHHHYLNISHITKNPIVLVSVGMSVLGWIIAFIGTCILGRYAGGLWWIIIFELLLIGGFLFSVFKKVFHHYRLMFLIFLGVSISLLTQALDGLMRANSPGHQTAGAGAVIIVVMQFFWVILYASTEDSAVYQFIYSGFSSPVSPNGGVGNYSSPKESKVALSSPEASSQYSHHHQQSITSIHTPIQNTIPPVAPNASNNVNQQQQPQNIMATALHPYQANPDDPNELSFSKEEVLEILNKSGNWWQAKKQDGTVGIVPSNYFSP